MMLRSKLATVARAASYSVSRTALRPASLPLTRSFSISPLARNSSGIGSADAELVAALRSEQKIEKESLEDEAEELSRFHSFAERAGFKLIETAGAEEVQLVRQQGNETVRVYFSISDVINSDSLLDDVDGDEHAGGAAAKQEENGELEDESDFETPIRLNVVVEKPAGALSIEAVVQDDLVLVESITPYESGELARDETAEGDYKRRMVYQGPPFNVLDPSVQGAVQEFLESRNIDGGLALFIAQYSSFRENQEYISWLGDIAKIVESQ